MELVPFPVFRGRFVVGAGKSQQQVPHRAFGPVRNDKGWFRVGLRVAGSPLFHGGVGCGGDSSEFNSKIKSEINVKGDGQGCPSNE